MVAEDGSHHNSTGGAVSAHVENKTPDDNGCQTMEIENVRREKTIKKGVKILDEPFLLE